jgi:hypothetical protein
VVAIPPGHGGDVSPGMVLAEFHVAIAERDVRTSIVHALDSRRLKKPGVENESPMAIISLGSTTIVSYAVSIFPKLAIIDEVGVFVQICAGARPSATRVFIAVGKLQPVALFVGAGFFVGLVERTLLCR